MFYSCQSQGRMEWQGKTGAWGMSGEQSSSIHLQSPGVDQKEQGGKAPTSFHKLGSVQFGKESGITGSYSPSFLDPSKRGVEQWGKAHALCSDWGGGGMESGLGK